MKMMRAIVLAGNVLMALWIIYNSIDSGFSGTKYEIMSFVFLLLLLSLNSFLLIKKVD